MHRRPMTVWHMNPNLKNLLTRCAMIIRSCYHSYRDWKRSIWSFRSWRNCFCNAGCWRRPKKNCSYILSIQFDAFLSINDWEDAVLDSNEQHKWFSTKVRSLIPMSRIYSDEQDLFRWAGFIPMSSIYSTEQDLFRKIIVLMHLEGQDWWTWWKWKDGE